MVKFFTKIFLTIFVLVFFIAGGYLGYLSALVDLDELKFFEQVIAVTDKQRLEKQLARAKSILDARSRAYIRKSEEFLKQMKEKKERERKAVQLPKKPKQVPTPVPPVPPFPPVPPVPLVPPAPVLPQKEPEKPLDEQVDIVQKNLNTFQKETETIELPIDEQKELKKIQSDEKDLQFFQDEVKVLGQMVARQPSEEEIHQATTRQRKKRKVSDNVRKLLLLADKQKQLSDERKKAKEGKEYWQEHPKQSSDSISITVSSKDDMKRDLNPLHITQISTALSIMPAIFPPRLQNLYIVYGDQNMRRGMTGVGVVFMKGEELDFFRVLIHEFGHAYDLHREVNDGTKSDFYDGEYRLFVEDPSVTYYQLSWANIHDRTKDLNAFASSYGMSDPFEDFAEIFALYVLQGKTFSAWQEQNDVIRNKYAFLRNVFFDRAFSSSTLYSVRPYDVTMMGVNYEELLGNML